MTLRRLTLSPHLLTTRLEASPRRPRSSGLPGHRRRVRHQAENATTGVSPGADGPSSRSTPVGGTECGTIDDDDEEGRLRGRDRGLLRPGDAARSRGALASCVPVVTCRREPRKQNPGRIPEGRGGPGAYTYDLSAAGRGSQHLVLDRGPPRRAGGVVLPGTLAYVPHGRSGGPEAGPAALHVEHEDQRGVLRAAPGAGDRPAERHPPAADPVLQRGLVRQPCGRSRLGGRGRIADAKTETAHAGHTATPGRLVAALSFGFWVSLLGSGGRMNPVGRRANYEIPLGRAGRTTAAAPTSTPLAAIARRRHRNGRPRRGR